MRGVAFAVSFFLTFGETHTSQLSELVDLAGLMYKQRGRTVQVSSYDRTGGNDDGFSGKYSFLRRDERGEYVLMESGSPGIIVRMWFTDIRPAGRIRFYFDGESVPTLDVELADLFSGRVFPFVYPLAGNDSVSSGGFYSYVPMTYKAGCKITTTGLARFYHIVYRELESANGLKTFDHPPDDDERLGFEQILKTLRTEIRMNSTPKRIVAKSQSTVTLLQSAGPKYVRGLAIQSEHKNPLLLRRMILRMYWDDVLAVEVPLLDFFGVGLNAAEYNGFPIGHSRDGMYCRFPMPFRSNGRIEIANGNDVDIELGVTAIVDAIAGNMGDLRYFHARFREDTSKVGQDITILDVEGAGHFVGVNQSMQSFPGHIYTEGGTKLRNDYMEGDERISVDGSLNWHGTGTEDYYNGGWYFTHGRFSLPFHGVTEKDERSGSMSMYRYHVADVIPFASRFQMTMEHGAANNREGVYYSSTAYWYQDKLSDRRIEPLTASAMSIPQRIVWEEKGWTYFADSLKLFSSSELDFAVQPWPGVPGKWYGLKDVVVTPNSNVNNISHRVDVPLAWTYEYSVKYSGLKEGAVFSVGTKRDTMRLGIDTYADEFQPERSISRPLRLESGMNEIVFTVVPSSEGQTVALTAFKISPIPEGTFVPEWHVVGPFPFKGGTQTSSFGPERDLELENRFAGPQNSMLSWKKQKAGEDGILDLNAALGDSTWQIAFAGLRMFSSRASRIFLFVGSDDGVGVWLNGTMVWSNNVQRGLVQDSDAVPVILPQGWSTITFGVTQTIGKWQLAVRIPDFPDKQLIE